MVYTLFSPALAVPGWMTKKASICYIQEAVDARSLCAAAAIGWAIPSELPLCQLIAELCQCGLAKQQTISNSQSLLFW